ncbi:hypothetical protein [Aquimarina aggregata]|uniref:hypothetical protein n=1 Tax=Aquimarina aggregata TaxID=1642818 RepID=UPI002491BDA3|nr:hypothetical protein [Aquimarina aggregata]
MEIYAILVLKDTSDEHIDDVNTKIEKSGYPLEQYGDRMYRPFSDCKRIEELDHFVGYSEEEDSPELLAKMQILNDFEKAVFMTAHRPGMFVKSISHYSDVDKMRLIKVFCFAYDHYHLFNWDLSQNCDLQTRIEHGVYQ